MEELTKEQRQIIEEEIKKEIKKANTFLKPELINKIIQDIIGDIKGKINNKFKCPKKFRRNIIKYSTKSLCIFRKRRNKTNFKIRFLLFCR